MKGVSFLWPQLLWLLLLVPSVAGAYLMMRRQRRRVAGRFSGLSLMAQAMGAGSSRWRRWLPLSLFLVALILMVASIARPSAVITLPSQHQTIILAIDVSGSMRASDVKPNRLEAAQAAARSFVERQPAITRLGIVSFAATASVVQPPTHNRQNIMEAIDRFQVQRGTAIGSAIVVSLATLFPSEGIDLRMLESRREARKAEGKRQEDSRKEAAREAKKPEEPGSYTSAAIILVTDGQTTAGPDPIEAARMAAERGVRVYTVGIGTLKGEVLGGEGWSMRVRLDEDTLKAVAGMTHGEYFHAGNSPDLMKVYDSLNARFTLETRETEITAMVSAVAALFALVAAMLSLYWFNRIL